MAVREVGRLQVGDLDAVQRQLVLALDKIDELARLINDTTNGQVLRRSAGVVGFGALNLEAEAAINGQLPIANGGTGESTARAAMAALKGIYILGHSNVAVSHTGNTNETILATVSVPAGAMGLNGSLRVTALWTATNDASNKTPRVRFGGIGGTEYVTFTLTTQTYGRIQGHIGNRGAANSQVGGRSGGTSGAAAESRITSAVNTAGAVDVVFTGQLADATDTITLESYLVELIVP